MHLRHERTIYTGDYRSPQPQPKAQPIEPIKVTPLTIKTKPILKNTGEAQNGK